MGMVTTIPGVASCAASCWTACRISPRSAAPGPGVPHSKVTNTTRRNGVYSTSPPVGWDVKVKQEPGCT